jgi:hypothetical protein
MARSGAISETGALAYKVKFAFSVDELCSLMY